MFPLVAAAFVASVSGIVLDPQDLTVSDARVELRCAGHVEAVITDREGRFTVASMSDDCTLWVTHEGFTPFHHIVKGHHGPVMIRLRVAPLQHRVEVVAPRPPPAQMTFGSIFLNADEQNLRAFAGTTADLVRYAQLLAGTASRPASLSVDGLLADTLPPIDAIAHISIHGDPFSAEYADADVTSIDIVTKAPARTFRFFMGGDTPGVDGRDLLAPALRTASRFANLGVRGPVPHLALTFSASINVSRSSQEMPIQATLRELGHHARAEKTANRNESGSLSLHYAPAPSLHVRLSFREAHARGINVGVGGVTLQEAGFASAYLTRESRVTATKLSSRFLYEGGGVIATIDSRTRANATTPGVTVGGDAVMGGASISDSRRRTMRWTAKHVVRSKSLRPWTAGLVMTGTHDVNRHTPNGGGSFYFVDAAAFSEAVAGGNTGTWYVTRGGTPVRFSSQNTVAFLQTELVRAGEFVLGGGVRADYESEFGVVASPRVSLAGKWRGVGVRAGAGLFVQRVPDNVFITIMENDGRRQRQYIATDAPLIEPAESLLQTVTSIQTRMADGLTRPRALQWRLSMERPIGSFMAALEYSVSADRHLLGSDRLRSESGLIDVFESNRSALRRRLHGYGRYAWKGHQFVAEYEFAHARDNTDGPFSFPQQSANLPAEWARSAGVPAHSMTIMSTITLPAGVSMNLVDNWRSSAPFNITTGSDSTGNGLFLDRGGRARNSGDGPRFHSVSLYAHRAIEWDDFFKAPRGRGINISVQADNILNARNYLAIGSVAASTTFGMPLAAYPGRSVRLVLSVN